jgi:plasmid stabilization system protein ParE
MTAPLFVHPAARQAAEVARLWYDDISTALGNDFAQAVAEAIDLIHDNPRLFADIGDGIHRELVRRFPYQVFYRIGTVQVSVLAVYHGHADRQAVLERVSTRDAQQ